MNDPQLAAALRSRSPGALPELLDAYGDQLFSYCWCLLRNRENAQIAVRDALVVATAQIGRLVCDEWLGLWLYSLARAECLRREAVPASDADEPVALPNTADAEILIRKSHACPDRAAPLSGWTGTTPALRDRVLEHAATCSVCSPNLPRSVSPARVFALLPAPVLSSVARLEVLGFFDDSRKAAYREFTVSRAGIAPPGSPPQTTTPPAQATTPPQKPPCETAARAITPAPRPAQDPPPRQPGCVNPVHVLTKLEG